jgi:RNA polymerase sigma-70 factor (ECF subfamily)
LITYILLKDILRLPLIVIAAGYEGDMNDRKLIRLILEDPDRGIAKAVHLYGRITKVICRNILNGFTPEDVEEAWSDTFVRLWEKAGRFDERRNASLRTFICMIARSVALDKRRKCMRVFGVSRTGGAGGGSDGVGSSGGSGSLSGSGAVGSLFPDFPEDEIVDVSVDIENDFARRRNGQVLHEVVAEMPEPDRTIFTMRFFYFFSVKDIAERTALKPKQVEYVLHSRKKKLQEALQERGITNE